MNQRNRNLGLLGILVSLVAITIAVSNVDRFSGKSGVSETKFTIINPSELDRVSFVRPSERIELSNSSGSWLVNGTMEADPYLMELFFSLMNRIRVNRPLEGKGLTEIQGIMDSAGVSVGLSGGGRSVMEFLVVGDPDRGETYFMDPLESTVYLMRVPGYSDYLAPIFTLKGIQWRNRMIFQSSWRSIKRLRATFPAAPDNSFEIIYEQNFLEIPTIAAVDTTKMMDYVKRFAQFPSEGFIDVADYPQYEDWVKSHEPTLRLELEDIEASRNRTLTLYPRMPGDPYVLGLVGGGEMALFNPSRVENIMVTRDYFSSL